MNEKQSKTKTLLADFAIFLGLLVIDQITKVMATGLKDRSDVILIDGVFQLHYLENRGAAFSMLQDARWVFVLATAVMIAVILYILCKVPVGKRFVMWHICLTMIGAGGIGNLIDRLRFSYVIDFLYFSLINFPVFNFADICVTVGVFALIITVLFFWKDEDMAFLNLRREKKAPQDNEDASADQK